MKAGVLSVTLTQHTIVKSGTLVTAMPEESKKVQIRNQVKVNLFCDHWGVLHKDFVSQGQTVNQFLYWEVLDWFKDIVLGQSTTSREHCKTSQKKTSSSVLVLKGITLKF